jgi:hypothetical protein
MACWTLQSRSAEVRGCSQTNGLAGSGYAFMLTAVTPLNTIDACERTDFCHAGGAQALPDHRDLCASPRVIGLQRSLGTT